MVLPRLFAAYFGLLTFYCRSSINDARDLDNLNDGLDEENPAVPAYGEVRRAENQANADAQVQPPQRQQREQERALCLGITLLPNGRINLCCAKDLETDFLWMLTFVTVSTALVCVIAAYT
jgi:hypothetical protein